MAAAAEKLDGMEKLTVVTPKKTEDSAAKGKVKGKGKKGAKAPAEPSQQDIIKMQKAMEKQVRVHR